MILVGLVVIGVEDQAEQPRPLHAAGDRLENGAFARERLAHAIHGVA